MGALEEAQQRFHKAIERLEQAFAKAAKRHDAQQALAGELAALKSSHAALEAEHTALRKQHQEISHKLDGAVSGLREVLEA